LNMRLPHDNTHKMSSSLQVDSCFPSQESRCMAERQCKMLLEEGETRVKPEMFLGVFHGWSAHSSKFNVPMTQHRCAFR
jgi:hypothetical protein